MVKACHDFSPPLFHVDRFAIFKFRTEILGGEIATPLEGDEFSRLNFSRFNFLKRDAAGALAKFSFLVATRGKQSRETSSPLEVDRSGSASGKLKMATEFSWYRARFFRRNLVLPRLV